MTKEEINKLYRKGKRKAIREDLGIEWYVMRIIYSIAFLSVLGFVIWSML